MTLLAPPPGDRALNEPIVLAFGGPLEPLSVDEQSAHVTQDDGREVQVQRHVRGGRLWVYVVVTPELYADQPESLLVELTGGPSPRAVRLLDGRALSRTTTVRVPITCRLRSAGSTAPRLRLVDGVVPSPGPFSMRDPLSLVFDGVLDPVTVNDAACPLFPVAGAVELTAPVLPRTDWNCVGEQFELRLSVPLGAGRLRLVLRQFGVRDLSGRSPEPALRAELDAS